MSKKIKVWLIWIWNCAKSIIEWIEYYKNDTSTLCGYSISDIEVCHWVDIAKDKVWKDISEAIYASPNNAYSLVKSVPDTWIYVSLWNTLDGCFDYTKDKINPSKEIFDERKLINEIKEAWADIYINMLPTWSDKASEFYADLLINKLNKSFVNGMPTKLISSWRYGAKENVLIWDDIKSQIGWSILNRYINKIFNIRNNIVLDKMYQINYAWNTDFLNLMYRGESKHKSKKNAVSNFDKFECDTSINVSYVENMKDRKTCKIKYEWKNFWGAPFTINVEMEVEDSPNFAGSMVDVIRYAQWALDKKEYWILENVSALYMKTPPRNIDEEVAISNIAKFIF